MNLVVAAIIVYSTIVIVHACTLTLSYTLGYPIKNFINSSVARIAYVSPNFAKIHP